MVNGIIFVLCRDVARRVSTQNHSVPAEWFCKNNQNPNTECRPMAEKIHGASGIRKTTAVTHIYIIGIKSGKMT